MTPIEFVYVCKSDGDTCNKVNPRFEGNRLKPENNDEYGCLNNLDINESWNICNECSRNTIINCSGELRCVSQNISQL